VIDQSFEFPPPPKAKQFLQLASSADPWSSFEDGDEQPERPKSQTTSELCHAGFAYIFGFNIKPLGLSSLHLQLLKSSMAKRFLQLIHGALFKRWR